MPLELLSLSTYGEHLSLFESGIIEEIKEEFALDGLEILPIGNPPSDIADITTGVHLPFQPVWLPFWFEDRNYLREVFPGEENLGHFFGGSQKKDFIQLVRDWLKKSLRLKPQYLVFHAANCNLEEVFSLSHRYDKKTVLREVANLVNEALADPLRETTILLLFENLWWPGLTLREPWEVDYLFGRLKIPKEQLGIMLDVGHLLNTRGGTVSEEEAIGWLQAFLTQMPSEIRKSILGVHLHLSLSRPELWRPDERGLSKLFQLKDPLKRYRLARERVAKMDEHRPFRQGKIAEIINYLGPKYLVHEFRYTNSRELRWGLKSQKEALGWQ